MKAKYGSLARRSALQGYLFILPLLIGLLVFFLWPVADSFRYSLSDITMKGQFTVTFAGLRQYHKALFEDTEFRQILTSSVIRMVTTVPLVVIFSFFMATILNQRFVGRTFARLVLFLPVITASAAMMAVDSTDMLQTSMTGGFKDTFSPDSGIFSVGISQMVLELGFPDRVVGAITTAVDTIYETISFSGVQILIFLAGLQSIPSSLYEASRMEGATNWESFWKITFPMVSPLIFTCFIYSIIDSFTAYNNAVMKTVKQTAFVDPQDFGLSAAMSWSYFLIILLFLGLAYLIFARKVFYYDK